MKRIKLSGNILWLQMYSLRDKSDGTYLVHMDGNVMNTIHQLYNQRNDFESVQITIPNNVRTENMSRLYMILSSLFDGKVSWVETDFGENNLYSDNASTSRDSMQNCFKNKYFDSAVRFTDQIVSDFPVANLDVYCNSVSYHFCQTKDADDNNEPWTKYFDLELQLSKSFDVILFNQKQVDYFKAHGAKRVFRSYKPFNADLFRLLSEYVDYDKDTMSIIDKLFDRYDSVLFFPFRIDDTRFEFENILSIYGDDFECVLITNPTKVDLQISRQIKADIIDLSNRCSRTAYMYILCKYGNRIKIIHRESDFHTGTAEQYILCRQSMVCKHLTDELIRSYVEMI